MELTEKAWPPRWAGPPAVGVNWRIGDLDYLIVECNVRCNNANRHSSEKMARNPTSKLIDLDPIIFESSERSISQNPTLEVEEQRSRERREGHTSKWLEWMDQALVCQVLATDPINCARGNTVAKWTEVSAILQKLEPQPVKKSPESCRQRVKKLVEIYKVS